MIRIGLVLFLSSCSFVHHAPKAAAPTFCMGMAGFSTGVAVIGQLDGSTLPEIPVDVSECIDLAVVCDAQRTAWTEYLIGASEALNGAILAEEAKFTIPAVHIEECPAP